jgi:hypothetical protein
MQINQSEERDVQTFTRVGNKRCRELTIPNYVTIKVLVTTIKSISLVG